MKKKLKKVLIPIFFSVICGAICGRLVYDIYAKKLDGDINGEKIYLVQAGAYSTYDNMVSSTMLSNYVYYEDTDGLYKSIIGLTSNYDNVEKIKSTYKDLVIINEYYSKDNELNRRIKEYDLRLESTDKEEEIKDIVNAMLALYKDKNTTLTQIDS